MAVFLESLWGLSLELAPWLMVGLVCAGLIQAWVPMETVGRWLGRKGPMGPVLAAVVGAPLPLCSCSVMPVAVGLRRQGATRGSTGSFLVSTPENGVDSVAVSYALLGPFLTVVRPIAGIVSAVLVGWLIDAVPEKRERVALPVSGEGGMGGAGGGCGCGCGPEERPAEAEKVGWLRRVVAGQRFAFKTLLGDLLVWLLLGLVAAAAVLAFVPSDLLVRYGSGWLGMGLALLIGVPMYICAVSSVPIAAAMLLGGVSPGVVVVFLLAGPATNLGTFGVVRRELGRRAAWVFVVGVAVTSVGFGVATDAVALAWGIEPAATLRHGHRMVPEALAWGSLVVLVGVAGWVLWGKAKAWRARNASEAASPCCSQKVSEPA
ncbi:MAG: SO_0444 family Cu/Zn efflux transporter [Planctomycetota bacterium]